MQMARPFLWSLCCSAGRRRLQQGFSAALFVSSRLFWWPFSAKDAHGNQQRHQGERSEERGHSLRRMGLWYLTARAASTNLSGPKVTTIYADKRSVASWHAAAGYLGTRCAPGADVCFWFTICLYAQTFGPSSGWNKTCRGKKSLPRELMPLGTSCSFCGSGSSVAKSNLWIIIYKRQPNSELFAQCLVSSCTDKLLWKLCLMADKGKTE